MTKYHLCFVAGTKVHTSEGLKNIEEICVGDVVVSRSEHDPSGDNSLRRVTELFVTHPKRLLTVRYRTGDTVEELTCTATHPFFVREQAGFVPAEELKVGWHFSLVDGQEATIEEIRETVAEEGASFTTYNFSVEEEHTYFVGPTGVWVHFTQHGQSLRRSDGGIPEVSRSYGQPGDRGPGSTESPGLED